MSIQVQVTVSNGRVTLRSPYHPRLPGAAKQLGGTWNGTAKTWGFDARDEDRVRQMCREVYGSDGAESTPMVTIRHRISQYVGSSLWLAGREIARRPGRDSGVLLGPGVIVVEGRFPSRGGSVRNPAIREVAGTPVVVEIRDVPQAMAESLVDDDTWIVTEEANRRAVLEARLVELRREVERVQAELDTLA